MNSKVVNKLIRSEIWPLLRSQGFSKFASRNAWRHREPLIDVVNFQSFNSYVAGVIGCTTYSFALNLGIYIIGGPNEEWVRKDSAGRLLPQAAHCPFQVALGKRQPIDGFERLDIFHIDGEGSSMGPICNEVRHVLQYQAPQWFAALGNREAVIAWMTGSELPGLPEGLGAGVTAAPGSYVWNDLLAELRPSLENVDRMIGSMQDCFSPFWSTPRRIEKESRRAHMLLQRQGVHSPTAEIWTATRKDGFAELTNGLAHGPSGDAVELVAAVPMDGKRFALCAGVFWPELGKTESRPKLKDCQLQICLTGREDFAWLSLCQDPATLAQLLENPDWKIFTAWPTMRGHGSHGSEVRARLMAMLASKLS